MDKARPQFTKLFSPGRIGSLELQNRLVIPPMVTRLADGVPTRQLIDHYEAMAGSGVGLVTVESTYADPVPLKMNFSQDAFIPRFKEIADVIHKSGAKAAIQMNLHQGTADEMWPLSPSDAPANARGVKPAVASEKDIRTLLDKCGQMARRVKEAGFDAISIHAGYPYLVSAFLSPLTNKRTDRYGGNVENRANLAVELLQEIKAQTGRDFPLIFRFTVFDHRPGGFSLQDGIITSRIVAAAGADAIDIKSGPYEYSVPPAGIPHGHNIPLAAALKRQLSIPVLVAGSITDPHLAEATLQEGQADFICCGRTAFADPQFARKWQAGRPEDVRPCIRCMYCQVRFNRQLPVRCAVNPAMGRENEFAIKPAKTSRRVVVLGGGPSGMETAIVAAQRGHRVTLFEKESELGGQLVPASMPPGKEDIKRYIDYLRRTVQNSGIEVIAGTAATMDTVRARRPDAVIVATGARPVIPDIPGAHGDNVATAIDVLLGKRQVGNEVVVVGGGKTGCEVALFLAAQNKKVIIVEMLDSIAHEIDLAWLREFTIGRLKDAGVSMVTGVRVKAITGHGVMGIKGENTAVFPADGVVLALGMKSDDGLALRLQGEFPGLVQTGDCSEPHEIPQATESGFLAAQNI